MKIKTQFFSVKRGFTLVELLVVVTIIIALAALGFLGFKNARLSADRVASTRNIAQLQFANTTYAADHNGDYLQVYAFDEKGIILRRMV